MKQMATKLTTSRGNEELPKGSRIRGWLSRLDVTDDLVEFRKVRAALSRSLLKRV